MNGNNSLKKTNQSLTFFEQVLEDYSQNLITELELISKTRNLKISSDQLQENWHKFSNALIKVVWNQVDENNWLWLLKRLPLDKKNEGIAQILSQQFSAEHMINLIHQEELNESQILTIVKNYSGDMDVLIKLVQKNQKYFKVTLPYLNVTSLSLLLPNLSSVDRESLEKIWEKPDWEILAYGLLKKANLNNSEELFLKEKILSEELLDAAWHLWREGDGQFLALALKYTNFDWTLLSWKQKVEVAEYLLSQDKYRFVQEQVWILNWKAGTILNGKFKTFPELSSWEEKILKAYSEAETSEVKIYGTLDVLTQTFELNDGRKIKNQLSVNIDKTTLLLGGQISALAILKKDGYEIFSNQKKLLKQIQKPEKIKRNFGVELEFCLAIPESEFIKQKQLKNWSCKPDLSIVAQTLNGNPAYSTEVVSPVLDGESGIYEIQEITSQLGKDIWVNESCGFHVHHDLREYAEMEMAFESVMRESLWITQGLVYSLCKEHRQKSVYCLGFKNKKNEIVDPVIPERDKFGNQVNHPRPGFFLFSNHKTIEFRMKEGTANQEEIILWVEFSSAVVRFMLSRTHNQHRKMKVALNDLLYWSEKLKKFSPSSRKVSKNQKKIASF